MQVRHYLSGRMLAWQVNQENLDNFLESDKTPGWISILDEAKILDYQITNLLGNATVGIQMFLRIGDDMVRANPGDWIVANPELDILQIVDNETFEKDYTYTDLYKEG